MALLTHGPRLGDPRSDGFKAWVRTDGAATVKLYTRPAGAGSFTLRDTQAIDVTKYNTAILTVTGLDARTSYDYYVAVDDVAGTTYTTITMPNQGGGRFVLYFISDTHDSATNLQEASTGILADKALNYPDIPAAVIIHGDLILDTGTLDQRTADAIDQLALAQGCFSKLPVLYMWDDWDFGGNNSCFNSQPGVTPAHDVTVPQNYWDRVWRLNPRPASPSYGYAYEIAGVPIIMSDSRSQKGSTMSGAGGTGVQQLFGNEPYTAVSTLWGATQHEWLRTQLINYHERALVLFICTHTVKDSLIPYSGNGLGGGARDSCSLFHRGARNNLFRTALEFGYGSRGNLVIHSGDDHRKTLWWHLGLWKEGISNLDIPNQQNSLLPTLDPPAYSRPQQAADIPLNFAEIVVATQPGSGVGQSQTIFGYGNAFEAFDPIGTPDSIVGVWDITSTQAGKSVEGRFRFMKVGGSQPGTTMICGAYSSGAGRAGDFYFKNGVWQYYNATNGLQTQLYPVDSVAPQDFTGAWVDDITGLLVRENDVIRDEQRRLRDKHDIGDRDRDELLQEWHQPIEQPVRDP